MKYCTLLLYISYTQKKKNYIWPPQKINSWLRHWLESTMDKIIMNNMTINLDMFSLFMENIIASNMNGTLAITIKKSSRGCRHI